MAYYAIAGSPLVRKPGRSQNGHRRGPALLIFVVSEATSLRNGDFVVSEATSLRNGDAPK